MVREHPGVHKMFRAALKKIHNEYFHTTDCYTRDVSLTYYPTGLDLFDVWSDRCVKDDLLSLYGWKLRYP